MDLIKFNLETLIFDVISELYASKLCKDYTRYRLALATLDILNAEYEQKFLKKAIDENRIMKYYEDLWCF
jgi:hypothetical protein